MTFGEWLRDKRLDKGETMQEFAQACDLSYVSISNIELGKKKPGMNALRKIAAHINMEYVEVRQIMKDTS